MVQNPKIREDYRSSLNNSHLKRNNAFFHAASGELATSSIWKRLIGLLAVCILGCGIAYAAHMYFMFRGALGDGNTATSTRIATRRPISVLILGVDQGIEGRHEQGNSDTMIMATANPAKNTATLTSIPRDTLADIKGDPNDKYFMFRINSAYEVGGNQAAVKTVTDMLNVPVQYYVEVNMKALKSLVNAVGGVDVDVPFSFSYDWEDFHKGKQHMKGRKAVAYVRMRKEDPGGDYGRQLRQRQIIEAIAKKAMSVDTISNYRKLIKIFNKYVKTNMSSGDMMSLAMNYRGCMKNLKSDYIHGHDAWINGASIQVASTKELQRNSNIIRDNLNLPRQTLNNEETRQNHLNNINNHIRWKDPSAFTNYQIFDQDSDSVDKSDDPGDTGSAGN